VIGNLQALAVFAGALFFSLVAADEAGYSRVNDQTGG